jgi:type II secretory pathway component GspD/PulD (secretin)
MTMSTQVPLREVRIDPGTQAQTITWKQQQIPISLKVTPHVLADGTVDMAVNPKVEAVTGWAGPPTDQQPITSKREASTQIRVRDGEVAVIGGLVREEVMRSVKKVPLLGDIPVLGELFKNTSWDNRKTELLIFIIPHVLPPQ